MQAAVCQKIQNAITVVAPREGGSSTQLYLQFAAYTMQCTVASLDVSATASWLWLNTTSQLQQQGRVSNLALGVSALALCMSQCIATSSSACTCLCLHHCIIDTNTDTVFVYLCHLLHPRTYLLLLPASSVEILMHLSVECAGHLKYTYAVFLWDFCVCVSTVITFWVKLPKCYKTLRQKRINREAVGVRHSSTLRGGRGGGRGGFEDEIAAPAYFTTCFAAICSPTHSYAHKNMKQHSRVYLPGTCRKLTDTTPAYLL